MPATEKTKTYGYDEALWLEARQQARAVLAGTAALRAETTMTYSQLAAKITAIKFAPHDAPFHALLGQLSEEEAAAGRGMLSVLVVRQDDPTPGPGFFKLAAALGRGTGDQTEIWAREFATVRAAHGRP